MSERAIESCDQAWQGVVSDLRAYPRSGVLLAAGPGWSMDKVREFCAMATPDLVAEILNRDSYHWCRTIDEECWKHNTALVLIYLKSAAGMM